MYILKNIFAFKLKIFYLIMKMPTIQEIKDKLPSVKVPQKLKEDLSFAGNTVIFLASPPAYFAKKGFTSKQNENWYEKSRRATLNFLGAGIVCMIGSGVVDSILTKYGSDITVKNSEQIVAYDFGNLTFSEKWNLSVKDDSLKSKAFLPFERLLNLRDTYSRTNGRTAFEGTIKRNGLDYLVEGNMPLTTNVTAISVADLSKYTDRIHLGQVTRDKVDLLYGLDKK